MNKEAILGAMTTPPENNRKEDNLKIFANVIDEKTMAQISELCGLFPYSHEKVRVMPDVHSGKGCVIGFTSTTTQKKINPDIVGSDIGCGMTMSNLGEASIDFFSLHKFIEKVVEKNADHESLFLIDRELQEIHNNAKEKVSRIEWKMQIDGFRLSNLLTRSLGTLGGGNHFIEIGKSFTNSLHCVVHSGSRSLGGEVVRYYKNKSKELLKRDAKALINSCVPHFRAIRAYDLIPEFSSRVYENTENSPYLHESLIDDYLHDINACVEFAKINRRYIIELIMSYLSIPFDENTVHHSIHNYIDNRGIIRKGACSADRGDFVIIPINMRDGILIGRGLGNPDWNFSAPHGAGRVMSRTEAKNSLSLNELIDDMRDVNTWSLSVDTIDESPRAYKSINDIRSLLHHTMEIDDLLQPVFNFKTKD